MKKENTKKIFFGVFLLITLIGIISAADVSYCCERTTGGAWCMNMDSQSECDTTGGLKAEPTFCESTSYCRMGCCYDSKEGTCSTNTAKKTCENGGGTWSNNADCEIEQCEEGCCIVGETAFWNTLTVCKKYASIYGLEANFRKDISSELQCIISTNLDVKGACVFEENGVKTCKFLTKEECNNIEGTTDSTTTTTSEGSSWLSNLFGNDESEGPSTILSISSTNFYEGFLCSAEQLATNCAKTEKTMCYNEKVYFVDSCGNIANIYDSSKYNDDNYWTKIVKEENSCGYEASDGNANSQTCGNCDYYFGSTCKSYQRGTDKSPKYGDNLCKDLSCKYNGKTYKHGETWCVTNTKVAKLNAPGSEQFRLSCYNGEVLAESCGAGSEGPRNLVCSETEINGYSSAGCVVNKWQDCTAQTEKDDCENEELRDCKWIKTTNSGSLKLTKEYCIPSVAPGFNFWEDTGTCTDFGTSGTITCVVTYVKSILGGKDCDKNCACEYDSWQENMAEVCESLGDCELEVKVGKGEFKEVDA